MRLREPLNGFNLASGHAMFHIAFLIGSFIAIEVNFQGGREELAHEAQRLIVIVRLAHAYVAATQILQATVLDGRGCEILGTVLRCSQVFIYQGTILYEQYKMLKFGGRMGELEGEGGQRAYICYEWLLMEISAFYLYMLAAIVFLAYIQIRGALGKTDRKLNAERWKFDALDYYDLDIDWFAFIFVMAFVHCYGIYEILFGTLPTASEERIQGEYVGLFVLGVLLFCRVIQMIFLSQLRGQDHKIKDHGHIVWIFNIVVYVFLLAAMCFVTQPSSFVKSQLAIDILMFGMQYLYYVVQKEVEKHALAKEVADEEDKGSKFRDSQTILGGLALRARSKQAVKVEEG